MADFDYEGSAGLYPSRRYAKSSRQQYRRFASAAAAIQFMVEELPQPALSGSFLEVEDKRYEGVAIRALYEADAYPLARRKTAA
jgi:hypothetical protein